MLSGASFEGQPIGSGPNLTAFSFYATKNLTTGEGGMLTGAADLLDHARVVSLHGMNREAWSRYSAGGKWAYDIVEPGFKYNMTDIQAALGLQQLKRFDRMQERRREIVETYNTAFGSSRCVSDADHTRACDKCMAPVRAASAIIGTHNRARSIHSGNDGPQYRHFGALHPDSYAFVLQKQIQLRAQTIFRWRMLPFNKC